MRPGQQNKQRMRGRGRKGPNPLSRSYESNGPDVKIRGTAQHIAEKYTTLARDAAASGDRVMAENYLQHAEHYGRIVAAAQGTFQLQQDENDLVDQVDDDGDEDVGGEAVYGNGQNGHNGNGNGQAYQQDRGQNDRSQYDRGQQDRGHQFDRGQGERGMRDGNRPNGNRDNNRDGRDFNREARDGNRGNREHGNFNRDGQQNRDSRGNEGRGNEGRGNEGRGNESRGNENRGHRERPALNGLGPQPVLPDTRPASSDAAEPRRERVRDHAPRDQSVRDPQPDVPVAQVALDQAAREDGRQRNDEPRAESEPRRRGRPRRIRSEDGAERASDLALEAAQPAAGSEQSAVEASQPQAVAASGSSAGTVADAPQGVDSAAGGDAKIKRKPGRPRKKKPEDEAAEGDHLPAFLMASNS